MFVCWADQKEFSNRLLLWINLCTHLKNYSFASPVKAIIPNNRVCNVGWQNCDTLCIISVLIALYFQHSNRKCLLVLGASRVFNDIFMV